MVCSGYILIIFTAASVPVLQFSYVIARSEIDTVIRDQHESVKEAGSGEESEPSVPNRNREPIVLDHIQLSGRTRDSHRRQRLKSRLSDLELDSVQSSPNGTTSGGKHAPTQSEVQLRRALRQKRRKLKRLWRDIERIQTALKSQSGANHTAVAAGEDSRRPQNDKTDDAKAKAKKRHWRRRIMQRLKLLSRLLQQQQKSLSKDAMDKLDALLASLPSDGQGNDKRGRISAGTGRRQKTQKQKKARLNELRTANSTSSTSRVAANATILHSVKHGNKTARGKVNGRRRPAGASGRRPEGTPVPVARTVIKKGEAGSACTSHKNCKPGFCCHQVASRNALMANTSGVCEKHRLKQGEPCKNSCQCDNEMQCFVSRKDRLYHKRLPSPDSLSAWSTQRVERQESDVVTAGQSVMATDGQCKIPAMDDVLHGVYIMTDNSLFKAPL